MVRGLYIAGTGMMLQRRRMETITNNIANADTTAYKKEHFLSHSFDEVLIERINDPSNNSINPRDKYPVEAVIEMAKNMYDAVGPLWYKDVRDFIGNLNLGTQVDHLFIDFVQGNLEGTERETDLAIVGESHFFVVQTPQGERYTRAGHFYIDAEGFLIDSQANRLQGANGDIYVGGLNFRVDPSGQVWTEEGLSDTIRIVSFEDLSTLRRQGDNLYFATTEPAAENPPYAIMQGFLESSNVDIGREMVDMLAMYRTYETNQRFVTMIDEINGKAVNEIARIR